MTMLEMLKTLLLHSYRWIFISFFLIIPFTAYSVIVSDIKVEFRNIKIQDPDFVLAHTAVNIGNDVDQLQISRDVKTLLATGRFSFVDAELTLTSTGCILTYIVEAKPILGQSVSISGADAMGKRRVNKWLDMNIGDSVDDSIMAMHVRKVIEEYHKRYYFDAQITWVIDVDPDTGFASARIIMNEGERASLRKVSFEGNTYMPPTFVRRIVCGLTHWKISEEESVPTKELINAIKDQIWHPFSFITKRGVYDPDILETDREIFKTIYQNNGYLDVQVGKPEVYAYKPQKLEAIFTINEGNQYRVGKIALKGVTLFPESNLWAAITIETGDVASMKEIYTSATNLRDYYQSRGYLRTIVKPVISANVAENIVDIRYDVSESRLIRIRYIDIRGNTRTKDEVIRREFLVYPGQVYDQVSIRHSERILRNLGFFSSVRSYARETVDPVQDDLIIDIEEKRTGQLMVGAGYSSIDEVIGFVELSQGNFDLFRWPTFTGGGQKLRMRVQLGTKREDYQLSFVEPWFLGRKLSLGLDLYDTTRDYLSDYYNQQRIGGAITLGKPIHIFFFQRADLCYSLERITIFDIADDAIQRIRDEEGSRTASTIKLTIIHDTRDSVFIPTRGNRTTLSSRVSGGILGFDTDVYGFEAESKTYFPLWFGHVFSIRAWAETVEEYGDDPDVPLFDRLFLGGARTLRGFKYRYICPYEEDEPIGGKTGAMACAEYTIPIVTMVRFATFYELGNVWLDAYDFDLSDYCSDAGIGIRLDIPGFPIRLDYAWPLEISKDVQRTAARFNFWLGYGF